MSNMRRTRDHLSVVRKVRIRKATLDVMLRRVVDKSIPEGTKKIAVWASGGIDSSTLLYYLKDRDVDGIHVYFEEGARSRVLFDEVTGALGLDGYAYKMTLGDHFRLLGGALFNHNGAMSAFPTMTLFMALKSRKYDLILHGLGLDELVGGYRQHAEATHCGFTAVENRFYDELPMRQRNTELQARKVGLNIAAPFIDEELRAYCQGLPRKFKTEGPKTKIVLRELMRNRIPDGSRLVGLYAGSKEGFHPPIREWWAQGLGEWVTARLSRWEKRRLKGLLWKMLMRANQKERDKLSKLRLGD